jgi:multicomponent K+:H+ antiporter subunit D
MTGMASHLIIAPIVLPLLTGGLLLLLHERFRSQRAALSVASAFGLIGIAIALLVMADAPTPDAQIGVYRLGNWPAPFAIVLVVDRLSALMLLLTSILGSAAVVFSLARWQRAGSYFHALFQFLLMGVNGAFLTGDLFNLFVFFELLLAASYGLALHGSGVARVKAGLHYIVVNLAASLLFLIGVSLIYSVSGTLNMADLAQRIPNIPVENRALLEAGAGILGVAFLVKAGMWPLCFWLPASYSAASPPVAAVFAILTKVGVYVVLRLSLLLFGESAGTSTHLGGAWLLYGGMATIIFGMIGVLASQNMARLAAYSVLISSGTVLAAIGMGQSGVTGGALFYLASSTLGISAFFLIIELAERGREPGADMIAITREAYGETEEEIDESATVGIAIPATMGVLGVAFMGCALVIAGLPPLSGFIGKFALLSYALGPAGAAEGATAAAVPAASWALLIILILSGFAVLIAMTRVGIRAFWASPDRAVPRVLVIEIMPVATLLALCAMQTVQAGPVMRYMEAAAHSLHAPTDYIREVQRPPEPQARREGGS